MKLKKLQNTDGAKPSKKLKKNPKKKNTIAKTSKPNSAWEKVRLAGNLISDDGGAGLEGFLGLEVLESYAKSSVTKEKFQRVKVNCEHNWATV